MDIKRITESCQKAGARVSGVNGYVQAESMNLTALFTPQGGVLLGSNASASVMTEQDYDLLRVVVANEPAREKGQAA